MPLRVHPLVGKDIRVVLQYYEAVGGRPLADRFFAELDALVLLVARDPTRFHSSGHGLRRANLVRFPYHLLFRQTPVGVRILVLRHHRRHPLFGIRRR